MGRIVDMSVRVKKAEIIRASFTATAQGYRRAGRGGGGGVAGANNSRQNVELTCHICFVSPNPPRALRDAAAELDRW